MTRLLGQVLSQGGGGGEREKLLYSDSLNECTTYDHASSSNALTDVSFVPLPSNKIWVYYVYSPSGMVARQLPVFNYPKQLNSIKNN